MKRFKCSFVCKAGHEMVVVFEGPRAMAEDWAAILDGSSDFYVHDPREDADSRIAHCMYDTPTGPCRALFSATVEEVVDG